MVESHAMLAQCDPSTSCENTMRAVLVLKSAGKCLLPTSAVKTTHHVIVFGTDNNMYDTLSVDSLQRRT